MLVAIQTALLVQATFIAALLLPETIVPIAMRFSVGVISVPVSALCGTIMFGRRNPGSSPGRKVPRPRSSARPSRTDHPVGVFLPE